MAEDCLYLNVTAPAGASGRPVLFWLHGGGFEGGQGPNQAGDGVPFAQSHGLVVVTVNYRLGALGFLDLPGERPTGAAGLHDQIAALRWTHENIAAFGGDPGQITVYGLSAGAKSVTNLLASPLTRGMIARAAESSGGDHVKDAAQARALTGRFLRELGTAAERLRSVSAEDILQAQIAVAAMPRSVWVWRPSVDGTALTAKPVTAIAAGAAAGIPLLLQTCARECAMYALLAPDAPRQADRVLAGYFGQGSAAKILAGYAARYPDLDEAALRTAVMTDERYVAPTERLADAQAAHGSVWRSRYDGPYTGLEDDPDPQFAQYAPLLRGRARRGRGRHLGGRPGRPERRKPVGGAAWRLGRVRDDGRPRLGPVRRPRQARDDLRRRRAVGVGRPVRARPRHLVGPGLAARHLVDVRRRRLMSGGVSQRRFLLLSLEDCLQRCLRRTDETCHLRQRHGRDLSPTPTTSPISVNGVGDRFCVGRWRS